MTLELVIAQQTDLVNELSDRLPENPFLSLAFLRAQESRGAETYLLYDSHENVLPTSAIVYRGRLNRVLHLISTPPVEANSSFWTELQTLASNLKVTAVQLESFCSRGICEPSLGRVRSRVERTEFVIDLTAHPAAKYATNQRRNIRRAQKAGLGVRATRDSSACAMHAKMINSSALRRSQLGRGGGESDGTTEAFSSFVDQGIGTFYQAVRGDGTVVCSLLVLEAKCGAYYHSGGSSDCGKQVGAPAFLIDEITCRLREAGKQVFNLGGATGAEPGLVRFKRGFGTTEVPLATVSCDLRAAWASYTVSVLERARRSFGV